MWASAFSTVRGGDMLFPNDFGEDFLLCYICAKIGGNVDYNRSRPVNCLASVGAAYHQIHFPESAEEGSKQLKIEGGCN